MGHGIGTVEVKTTRGKVHVFGMGQTNTGQKFIRKNIPLQVSKITDKQFKSELAVAIEEMLGGS